MQARAHGKRTLALSVAVGLIGLVGPSSASAATQIGQTFTPDELFQTGMVIQSGSPGGQYTVPSPGVITSWSFQASATDVPQGLKLKVARSAGGNNFTTVGESSPKNPTAGVLNIYTDVQIPVQAGDVLGLFVGTVENVAIYRNVAPALGYLDHEGDADVAPGASFAFEGPFDNLQVDVSATLEPDADCDGFGDETQDQSVTPPGNCPQSEPPDTTPPDTTPPDTTITKGPKDKTKKKTATFEFASSEPGSTFECRLDGNIGFAPCTSPQTVVTVGQGKHTFEVRAKDQAGNTDAAPVTDDWKVKKKKK